MENLTDKFEPIDLVAIILIIGCFVLIYAERDGIVSATLTLIVGYYFGKKTSSLPRP